MKVIGITGPSGSGKSTLSRLVRDNGYQVIDADVVAKELRPMFVKDIERLFGPEYIKNGQIDSRKLGVLVFNDRSQLHKLNHLMFPAIMMEISRRIKELQSQGEKTIFCDIAVLFTTEAEKFVNHIVLVTAPRLTRLERLVKTRKIDAELAVAQVDSVFITHDEIKRCDLIIVNDSDDKKKMEEEFFAWFNKLKVDKNERQD